MSSVCPLCGRMVAVFAHPENGLVLRAHRLPGSTDKFRSPWCQGGGTPLAR